MNYDDIAEEKEAPNQSDFQPKSRRFGVDIKIPCVKLSEKHPCKGCIWSVRDTDVLFCPFHSCVRKKNGFMPKNKEKENAD